MTTNAVSLTIEGERVVEALQDAASTLDNAGEELVLEFSSVRRIDTRAVTAMERLSDRAGQLGIRVVLRGVPIEVYRVLKLMKLAGRFGFRTD